MRTGLYPSHTRRVGTTEQRHSKGTLRLTLLGTFQIQCFDGTTWHRIAHPFLNQPEVRLLFGLLARCHERTASWEQVENTLWSLEEETVPPGRLLPFLEELHQIISEYSVGWCAVIPLVINKKETLHLAGQTEVWVDTEAFERVVEQSRRETDQNQLLVLLESALQLYTGDFLSEENELEGLLAQRVSLRWQAKEAFSVLAKLYKNTGKLAEAALVYERWIRFGFLDENVYHDIISTYIQLDRDEEAKQVYQALATYLSSSCDLDPHPKTYALYQTMEMRRESR